MSIASFFPSGVVRLDKLILSRPIQNINQFFVNVGSHLGAGELQLIAHKIKRYPYSILLGQYYAQLDFTCADMSPIKTFSNPLASRSLNFNLEKVNYIYINRKCHFVFVYNYEQLLKITHVLYKTTLRSNFKYN